MVVARGDYGEMAQRALTLLRDASLAAQMVEQARQECGKYSWPAVRDSWVNVYHGMHNDERHAIDVKKPKMEIM